MTLNSGSFVVNATVDVIGALPIQLAGQLVPASTPKWLREKPVELKVDVVEFGAA